MESVASCITSISAHRGSQTVQFVSDLAQLLSDKFSSSCLRKYDADRWHICTQTRSTVQKWNRFDWGFNWDWTLERFPNGYANALSRLIQAYATLGSIPLFGRRSFRNWTRFGTKKSSAQGRNSVLAPLNSSFIGRPRNLWGSTEIRRSQVCILVVDRLDLHSHLIENSALPTLFMFKTPDNLGKKRLLGEQFLGPNQG